MPTRRQFLKTALVASGAAGIAGAFPESIRKALAIEPEPGSTYLDAEHVVILMQENRSFDHCFGSLRGVRGFNDPRAITLPDGNPVWVQANSVGQRYVPFRLNIKDTQATWMGSLPHTWADQQDARNDGHYDRWLPAKRSGHRAYADLPLTLGYYTREDIPFYYDLADAFTICDQHFCSSLTGTTPNRLHLWTGTIRAKQSSNSPANVRNEDVDYGAWASWKTFPERLEEHGTSWKIYQNEITMESGLSDEQAAWLANFGDNPIEYFSQFNVQYAPRRRQYIARRIEGIPHEIEAMKGKLAQVSEREKVALSKQVDHLAGQLKQFKEEAAQFTDANFEKLPADAKSIHSKAFCANADDPDYRELTQISYSEDGKTHHVNAPKGDVLYQFRKDVADGKLPAVSWLVAPERFSDHPSSAWFGAWYVSQVLDILTQNPKVWEKTIFILTYDENDGYFDHVPPFVAPRPDHEETGKVSKGIDTSIEYVELADDLKRASARHARGGPIGLGFRVPMIVASPWSRGGVVCSQVFDHTSVLQLLEKWLTHKSGRKIVEPNISAWRRTVCGDLSSAFGLTEDKKDALAFPPRDEFIAQIERARSKKLPDDFAPLTAGQLKALNDNPQKNSFLPRQEPGLRRSAALPYQLDVRGALNDARNQFVVKFKAGADRFGPASAGAPFVAYAILGPGKIKVRNYAVAAGNEIEDSWRLDAFENGAYHIRVCGPNGFFREFVGSATAWLLKIGLGYSYVPNSRDLSGDVEAIVEPYPQQLPIDIELEGFAYGPDILRTVSKMGVFNFFKIDASKSFGWYDFAIRTSDQKFQQRYAGRVETGRWSMSDPQIGG